VSTYAQEMRRCQQVLAIRAVLEARGNQCAAARALGVHRNTIWRAVHQAGYTPERLKQMARIRAGEKKPPVSDPVLRTGKATAGSEGERKCS
jgi:Fis family transcriptional regulator, factor for inversion stimulation protein